MCKGMCIIVQNVYIFKFFVNKPNQNTPQSLGSTKKKLKKQAKKRSIPTLMKGTHTYTMNTLGRFNLNYMTMHSYRCVGMYLL